MAAFGTITIKGNAVDDIGTATALTLPILGMQAKVVPEEQKNTSPIGDFLQAVKYRLILTVVVEPFNVDPNGTDPDANTYFTLMKILGKRHRWLSAISSDWKRYTHATLGLINSGVIVLPLKVGVMEYGDLSSDFAKGIDALSIKFCSMTWYDIP